MLTSNQDNPFICSEKTNKIKSDIESELNFTLGNMNRQNSSSTLTTKSNSENIEPKIRDLIAAHNKEKALLQQKLEFTQLELKEVKEGFEEYKVMTDKMVRALNQNLRDQETNIEWEATKEYYIKEIIDIRKNSDTQLHKLQLTIGNCN